MMWIDVAMIAFSCVMMIHMGLVDAILDAYNVHDKEVPVITCPKCLTFWTVLSYLVITRHNVILSIAASFLASYAAMWFDLLLGQLDLWYESNWIRIVKCTEKNRPAVHNATNRKSKNQDGSMSKV